MQTTITRHSFCETCFKNGRPHSQEPYLAYGSTRNDYLLKFSQGNGTVGFTPTIFRIFKVFQSTHVIYDYACGICATNIIVYEGGCFEYKIVWKREMISIKEWNALCLYKDVDYWI